MATEIEIQTTKAQAETEWVGYAEASQITGLPINTLYSLVHRQRIPHTRFSTRMVRFSPTELRQWHESHRVPVTEKKR
jgi:excisionase family DNA binding protein